LRTELRRSAGLVWRASCFDLRLRRGLTKLSNFTESL